MTAPKVPTCTPLIIQASYSRPPSVLRRSIFGARSRNLGSMRPAYMSGGSTMWESAEISLYPAIGDLLRSCLPGNVDLIATLEQARPALVPPRSIGDNRQNLATTGGVDAQGRTAQLYRNLFRGLQSELCRDHRRLRHDRLA